MSVHCASSPLCFNSTMVRLEVLCLASIVPSVVCFNFTMVRLEDSARFLLCSFIFCFNSTMVRLEVRLALHDKSWAKFQFHNGSIRRRQVHWRTRSVQRFNSTMVRLEELSQRMMGGCLRCFNSTMVRLEALSV